MKSKARKITFAGQTRSIAAWARVTGINPHTLYSRFNAGWTPSDALEKPTRVATLQAINGAGPELALEAYIAEHRNAERQFRLTLRTFMRSFERQIAEVAQEAAKVMASEVHLREVARRYGVPAAEKGANS